MQSYTLLLFAVLFGYILDAGAEELDDCVRAIPSPVFNAERPAVVMHEFIRIPPREALERVQTGDGTRTEVTHSGCAHYGLRIRISTNLDVARSSASQVA
jgi:hypothetical protein